MSKFKRVLSDDDYFELHEEYDGSVFNTIYSTEQAVLAKLAEQEPVMYARTRYGEIDWDEARDGKEVTQLTLFTVDSVYSHGYAIIPLYTHSFATPMNSKTFCVSENEKCDTQTGGQVKNEKHKGN